MKYLFWCAFEHLNFRIPEFEALAKLFNIDLKWISWMWVSLCLHLRWDLVVFDCFYFSSLYMDIDYLINNDLKFVLCIDWTRYLIKQVTFLKEKWYFNSFFFCCFFFFVTSGECYDCRSCIFQNDISE